ncbi:transposase [Streptomyces sp. NPDC056323]|uniref:transposase n=1 Tax=Streptomyces sp. NPDC056323 TaxID=3345784 RepID=UPI0035DD4515
MPLIPRFRARRQGGGAVPVADRKVFMAVAYVLTSGCAWRYLPPTFGISPATASPVHGVDQGRPVVSAAPSGPGGTRCQGRVGLDLGDH